MSDVNARRERLETALKGAAEALSQLEEGQRKGSEGGAELIERVVAYAAVVVSLSDPDLITDDALTEIEAEANGIAGDPLAAASRARVYADDLLKPVSTLPPARDRDVEQAVKEAAATFQRSASQRLNALEADVEQKRTTIEGHLSTLQTAIDETSEATRSDIEALAQSFETKLGEYDSTLATQRQTFDEMVTRHSDAFTQMQEERAASFQGQLSEAKQQLEDFVSESRQEIEQHVAEIQRMEEESAALVGAIGLAGTAERYGEERDEQKAVADRMRALTIFFAIAAVAMAIFAVVHQAEDTSSVIAKLGVSAVLGGLATYTARQSRRHRVREERARSLQLELTAFAPFIEPLDKEQQDFERVIMARKTFGQIRALPEAETDDSYGPLGPVLDKIKPAEENG